MATALSLPQEPIKLTGNMTAKAHLVGALFLLAGLAAAAEDRKEACDSVKLPAKYEKYLDTSFLGPEKSVSVGPVDFSYFRFGPFSNTSSPGRTLVMVVGLGCTKSTWSPDLLHTLAENREVVVFDNRGSGHSKDPEWSEHASLEGYANSVVDLVHALELEQPDILGWSMGGIISLQLATHTSEAFRRFVIVSAGAPRKQGAGHALSPDGPVHLWEGETDPTAFFPDTDKGNAGLCRYIKLYRAMPKNAITEEEVRLERRVLQTALQDSDIYDKLGEISNPTLTVVGTKQGEGPGAYTLVEKIPTAMIVGFSDAAHAVAFQHSLEVGQAISAFLDSDIDDPETQSVQASR